MKLKLIGHSSNFNGYNLHAFDAENNNIPVTDIVNLKIETNRDSGRLSCTIDRIIRNADGSYNTTPTGLATQSEEVLIDEIHIYGDPK